MKKGSIFTLFLLLAVASASAHRMDLAYYMEGEDLVVEAWLGRDEPVVEGDVTVAGSDGTVLIEGKTDDKGVFRWAIPEERDLKITVFAGRGHQGEVEIMKEDLAVLRASMPPDEQPEYAREESAGATNVATTAPAPRVAPPSRSALISTQDRFGMPERTVIGLVFIFSAAAAWLSYQNNRRLKALEDRLNARESRD
ncbi:MAG: hypothetical protein GC154_00880 [bacterium]|nr:hypothetical protein [bacterium]